MTAQTFATKNQRNAKLEAQILENLDDPAAYLVYADWLQERGDPRGTWIALHARKGKKGAPKQDMRQAFLVEHAEALLGAEFARELKLKRIEIDWFMVSCTE